MKKVLLIGILSLSLSMALAVPDGWSSDTRSTNYVYTVKNGNNQWIIICNRHQYVDPIMTLFIKGSSVDKYDIVVDGVTYQQPYWKPAERNDGTLYNMWWALRKGKSISAKVNGKLYPLSSKNSAKALPSELDAKNFCIPSY